MITLASKTKFETEIKGLKEMLDAKEASIVALTKEFEAVKAELTELKNTPPVIVEKENTEKVDALTKENEELKAKVTDFEAKVAAKALEVVAGQGTDPVEVSEMVEQELPKKVGFSSRVVFQRNKE